MLILTLTHDRQVGEGCPSLPPFPGHPQNCCSSAMGDAFAPPKTLSFALLQMHKHLHSLTDWGFKGGYHGLKSLQTDFSAKKPESLHVSLFFLLKTLLQDCREQWDKNHVSCFKKKGSQFQSKTIAHKRRKVS